MSGILGLFNLDGKPVEAGELRDMASFLTRRGPDRTGTWHRGPIGFGHTLLATTPEMLVENLPLEHPESGCVITGDIRLDNRDELLAKLGLGDRTALTGDAGIVIAAYLEWGEACVERFLGDFAFAIWDPRAQALFCARDHMGMRQLIYHHSPSRFFAFATEPRAILVLPQTPYRINEARIADYLVQELEGIDKTSTFFEEVFRLPPAHTMSVTRDGMRQRRYWKLEPGPELRLPSDKEYAEAFLEVFTEAVRCRLRTVVPGGSMLSGGIDSGSVVAVARRLLADEGRGPLLTFSAVSPEGSADPETRAIRAALSVDGLEPTTVSYAELEELLPELEQLTREIDEPFDGHMTLIRCLHVAARRAGVNLMLDGVGGDTVLSEGRRIPRLLRSGSWRKAYREASLHNRFWNGAYPPGRELLRGARAAFVPYPVLRRIRPVRQRLLAGKRIRSSPVTENLASRVDLGKRLRELESHRAGGPLSRRSAERASVIDHPYLVVGRERYDRVAAAVGVEPRDPFVDVRVAAFAVSLPDDQTLKDGWPKSILRQAVAGSVPDEVRWRRGKEHLGWAFTKQFMHQLAPDPRLELSDNAETLRDWVDAASLRCIWDSPVGGDGSATAAGVYDYWFLLKWLQGNPQRPYPGYAS